MSKKTFKIDWNDEVLEVTCARDGDAIVLETADGPRRWSVIRGAEGEIVLDDGTGPCRLVFHRAGDDVQVVVDGRSFRVRRHHGHALDVDESTYDADHADLTAPMTGTVVETPFSAGDAVSAGDPVVVLEAMKMEHQLRAPFDGIVEELGCEVGQQVDMGDVLARLSRASD